MKVLYKQPYRTIVTAEISGSLQSMQELVKGHIETVPIIGDYILVCNDEGRINGMPRNIAINLWRAPAEIYGSFFICRRCGENLIGLDDCDIHELGVVVGMITREFKEAENLAYLAMNRGA